MKETPSMNIPGQRMRRWLQLISVVVLCLFSVPFIASIGLDFGGVSAAESQAESEYEPETESEQESLTMKSGIGDPKLSGRSRLSDPRNLRSLPPYGIFQPPERS